MKNYWDEEGKFPQKRWEFNVKRFAEFGDPETVRQEYLVNPSFRNAVDVHLNYKSKVKEVIDEIASSEHPEMSTGWATKLKKELGLE